MADPRGAQEAALANGAGEVQEHPGAAEERTSRHLTTWSNFREREIDMVEWISEHFKSKTKIS